MAKCHPGKPVHAKGLCENCYMSNWRTPEYNRLQNSKPKNREARRIYGASPHGIQKHAESQTRNDPDGNKMRDRGKKSYAIHRAERLDPEFVRASNLSRRGLSQSDYESKLREQDGGCAICQTPDPGGFRGRDGTKGSFAADHDHACCPGSSTCGLCNRGLLCMHCNHAIGKFKDSIIILEAAIAYLRKYQPLGPV